LNYFWFDSDILNENRQIIKLHWILVWFWILNPTYQK